MRILAHLFCMIFVCFLMMAACKTSKTTEDLPVIDINLIDSAFQEKQQYIDRISAEFNELQANHDTSLHYLQEVIRELKKEKHRSDSLLELKYEADYKLLRIQHYVDCCNKESNRKFLLGWIRRVLEN